MPTQETLKEHVIQQIHDNGYVSVGFELTPADITPLFTHFGEFVEIAFEPGNEKFVDALCFSLPGRDQDGDYWVRQTRIGEYNPHIRDRDPATEDKDVAHIGPQSLPRAEDTLGRHGLPMSMRRFLEQCREVHEAAKTAVRPVYRALGIEAIMLAQDPMEDVHLVRPLHYLTTEAPHQAELHFDRAKFTVAPYESRKGLIGAPGHNGVLRSLSLAELDDLEASANGSPIRHRAGEAKLFAGAGYNYLPHDIRQQTGHLPLLAHGVSNWEAGTTRDALVVFMNQHTGLNFGTPSKTETGFGSIRKELMGRFPTAYSS